VEIHTVEIRTVEIHIAKINSTQIRTLEIHATEVWSEEVPHVYVIEGGTVEVDLARICSIASFRESFIENFSGIRAIDFPLLYTPPIPSLNSLVENRQMLRICHANPYYCQLLELLQIS
jgi:hypothetical protein